MDTVSIVCHIETAILLLNYHSRMTLSPRIFLST
jgi:hypothetical protein